MAQSAGPSVIVVGAGVAGLVCAIELHRAGRSVLVIEAANQVGGRVRSSCVDDMVIDHGFQVLFTAYPTLRNYLDLGALALRTFLPAARIVRNGKSSLIGDALRQPALLLDTMLARAVPLGDKLRLLALRRFAGSLSIDDCFDSRFAMQSTREFLAARGFSNSVIEGFFAPFYGGILLDRSLCTSASVMLFTFKMLAEGDTAIPASGMGATTSQLASQLPPGSIQLGGTVHALDRRDARIVGVQLANGTYLGATDTVLATDAPTAVSLAQTAGITMSTTPRGLGCTTLYYTSSVAVLPGRALWLNADAAATISHAVTITDVAPDYDRRPSYQRALLAATALGDAAALDDDQLDAAARRDIALLARATGPQQATNPARALTRLAIFRVPYAQFAQPPGWRDARPTISCGIPGLWRASEELHSSSLEGAARGGRDAARALLHST